ncbi:MAG: potassium channel protein [bacterium]|nr:potassium channel protein [bacterium]
MNIRNPQNKVIRATILSLSVIGFGTGGYYFLEGWSLTDSLYMTIITMTTVGYGELYPLNQDGRFFTIVLILMSVGIVGYVFSTLTTFIVGGEIREVLRGRRMDKQLGVLKNHVILCGLGRIGLHIAEEFVRAKTPFVIIEQDEKKLKELASLNDILYLKQDAAQDDALLQAGIKEARGLVTTLGEDKDNVFVVLCARSLKPELYIVARLVEEQNEAHLRKAGANRIVSPDAIGGTRMASIVLRPAVVEFWDEMKRVTGETLLLEEVVVEVYPMLANRTLGDVDIRKRTGALVLAIKSNTLGYRFNPGAGTLLQAEDVLIMVGNSAQLDPDLWKNEFCA